MVLVISSIGVLVLNQQLTVKSASTKLTLNVSPNQNEMLQGSSLKAEINVTSIGKSENITLSSFVGSSSINCTFEPSIGESNFTSTLTVRVPDSNPAGNYTVTVIASSGRQSVNASMVLSVLTVDVTVSGRASSAALAEPHFTSLQKTEFTDIQTGNVTSFNFTFAKHSYSPFGNYSVTLKNEHTYNVTISYYMGLSLNAIDYPASDYIETFTVQAPTGQTAITEDFV
jgi:hypothetical protein